MDQRAQKAPCRAPPLRCCALQERPGQCARARGKIRIYGEPRKIGECPSAARCTDIISSTGKPRRLYEQSAALLAKGGQRFIIGRRKQPLPADLHLRKPGAIRPRCPQRLQDRLSGRLAGAKRGKRLVPPRQSQLCHHRVARPHRELRHSAIQSKERRYAIASRSGRIAQRERTLRMAGSRVDPEGLRVVNHVV